MTNKSEKIAKFAIVAGAGIAAVYLITKYRKNILEKLNRTKNVLIHDFIKLPRDFKVETLSNCNNEQFKKFIELILRDVKEFPVVGFDCEWVTVNNSRRKVALIQICTSEGICGLFRVCKYSNFPLELKKILEDPDIIKVGVTPEMDGKYLFQDYAVSVYGTFDLRFIALQSGHKAGGLGQLSKLILNIELDKDWRVRCSDWEAENLSKNQIDYAAKDAFVAIEIFKKLYNEMKLPTATHEVIKYCDNYSDISFKNKLAQLNLDPAKSTKSQSRVKDIELLRRTYSTRTTPLYDNCQLQAPDGELLCVCDRSKAEWYVSKGLGVQVVDEPVFTVRLNFEPAGRAVAAAGEYYKSVKHNRCVVCGTTDDLVRKNVIPHDYRKDFPSILKDKTSHDILLLCIVCHRKSNIIDTILRKKLAEKCNAPLDGEKIVDNREAIQKLVKQQRLARALLKSKNIPEDRIQTIKNDLTSDFPNQELNEEFLTNLIALKPPTNCSIPHGQIIVEYYKNNEGLIALEKMWREHFLELMRPQFMPELWNVNHNGNRLLIRANEGRVTKEELKIAGIKDVEIAAKKVEKVDQNQEILTNNSSNSFKDVLEDDDVDSSSEWEYQSAYSYRVELNKNSTDDERYFSDAASFYTMGSYKSDDTSTIADFRSFASSENDLTLNGGDSGEDTENFSDGDGSETEVEEEFKVQN